MNGKTNVTHENIIGALIPLEAPTGLSVRSLDKYLEVNWTDPVDKFADPGGELVSSFDHAVLVRKVGSEPTSVDDGTIVVTTTTRNQYQSVKFEDVGLSNGTRYYYKAYAYSQYGTPSDGSVSVYGEPRNAIPSYLGNGADGIITEPTFTTYFDNVNIDAQLGVNKAIVKLCDDAAMAEPNLFSYDENLIQVSAPVTAPIPWFKTAFETLGGKGVVAVGGGYGNAGITDGRFITDDLVETVLPAYYKKLYEPISFTMDNNVVICEGSQRDVDYIDTNLVVHQQVCTTTVPFREVSASSGVYTGKAQCGNAYAIFMGRNTGSISDENFPIKNYKINKLSSDYVVSEIIPEIIPEETRMLLTATSGHIGDYIYFIESQCVRYSTSPYPTFDTFDSKAITIFDPNLLYSRIDNLSNFLKGTTYEAVGNLGEYYLLFCRGNENGSYRDTTGLIDTNYVLQQMEDMSYGSGTYLGATSCGIGKYNLIFSTKEYSSRRTTTGVCVYVVE